MSKKHYIILGIFIAILLGYLIFIRPKQVAKAYDVEPETTPDVPKSVFPLRLGSRNEEVRKVQTWLLKNEGSQIKIDGIWGKETEGAVNKFLKVSEVSEDRYKLMGL